MSKKIYGDLGVRLKVGIEQFLEVAHIIRSICPTDPSGFYCAPPSEINAFDAEIDMEKMTFYELMAIYVNASNNHIVQKREELRKKHG